MHQRLVMKCNGNDNQGDDTLLYKNSESAIDNHASILWQVESRSIFINWLNKHEEKDAIYIHKPDVNQAEYGFCFILCRIQLFIQWSGWNIWISIGDFEVQETTDR